jgi:hypothetical protein
VIAATHVAPAACYINQIVLPVTLITLKAYLLPDGNGEIFWETASESNCKEFQVQHSTDSNNWTNIGTVAGSGDSSSNKQYTLQHNGLVVGRNFYRLWQVDFNGSKSCAADF